MIEPFRFCGCCYFCDRGQTNLCESGDALRGCDAGLQQYVAVDCSMVHTIHDEVPRKPVALTAIAADVASSLTKANIIPGDSVLVIGSDMHALVGIAFVRCLGADYICVVGRLADASVTQATACGASQFIEWHDAADPDAARVQDCVREHTGGRGFDTVFYTACPDPAGSSADGSAGRERSCARAHRSLTMAMRSVRRGGSIVTCRPGTTAAASSLSSCSNCNRHPACSPDPAPCPSHTQCSDAGGQETRLSESLVPPPAAATEAEHGAIGDADLNMHGHACSRSTDPGGQASRAADLPTHSSHPGEAWHAPPGVHGGQGSEDEQRHADSRASEEQQQASLLQGCLGRDVRFIGVSGFSSAI